MAHTFSKQLTPGTPENVSDVMTNFNEAATDWELAFSTYKTIVGPMTLVAINTGGAGTVLLVPAGSASAAASFSGVFYFDPADYTAATRTTKFRVRGQVYTNQVAPAITFTVGLYPVTVTAGASGSANTYAVGTVTTGSTVAFASPTANSANQNNSGDFTAPAAGLYILAVAMSGAAAVGSRTDVLAELQMRQV